MEKTKRDLESVVASQKEQLSRYEKRLKDVVMAYKGLLKEKEALEMSLAALTINKEPTQTDATAAADAIHQVTPTDDAVELIHGSGAKTGEIAESALENKSHLQTQIMTLMNSLATLSAEKSRMEASFQADKKQLRSQLMQKDQSILQLQRKLKESEDRVKYDVYDVKAKWILERQEHEKETNNQMLMIRELQKLYGDERHLKENIEMQLNNFKTIFANNEAENSRVRELQTQLKEAKAQLKQEDGRSKHSAGEETADSAALLLLQVQQEMQQLKDQHAIAIKSEQRRVLLAEEQSRNQAVLHEDRVANLEARLAELSNTVGSYDRLRQQDQESIQVLRTKLQELERYTDTVVPENIELEHEQRASRKLSVLSVHDLTAVVDEIIRLKKLLVSENARSLHPIDVSKIFVIGADHAHCQEEIHNLQQQCQSGKSEMAQLQERIHIQKSHICTLQEKVKVLNRNIEEQEIDLKQQSEKLRQTVKEERDKWKDALAERENDFRAKVNALEQQLQKQRQRSLQLLDDKEQEIKTLQTSFEIFHSATAMSMTATPSGSNAPASTRSNDTASSDAESTEGSVPPTANARTSTVRSKKLSVGENCHMLHYANEIARKDIEIVGLRRAKYAAETSLRKAIQEKVTAQEDLSDKIAILEEQVDRLERCKTREGANLEYLKNVIISFIVTKDADGKRHMMNAISAVLQFTPAEIQIINATFYKR